MRGGLIWFDCLGIRILEIGKAGEVDRRWTRMDVDGEVSGCDADIMVNLVFGLMRHD